MSAVLDMNALALAEIQRMLTAQFPQICDRVVAEVVEALHLQVERTPPIDEILAWEILSSYPCADMPFLTREYILALLTSQGILHPSDLQRFLLNWKRQNLIEIHGDHIIFNADTVEMRPETPVTIKPVKPDNSDEVLDSVLECLERSTSGRMTSIRLKGLVAPDMKSKKFRQILHKLQTQGKVRLENVRGLPLTVTMTT
jgi:hypothetical protein